MRKIILSLMLFMFVISAHASPQGFNGFEKGQSSIDFFAGQPVFFRYNNFINWKKAWALDAGYHFDKYPYFAANYIVYFFNIRDRLKDDKDLFNSLLYYAGPGVFLGPDFSEEKSDDKVKLGVRIFGGSEYIFKDSPWSIKAEIGPSFYIEGDDDVIGFQGMLGVTYYIGGIKKKKLKSRTTVIKDNTRKKKSSSSDEDDAAEFKEFD